MSKANVSKMSHPIAGALVALAFSAASTLALGDPVIYTQPSDGSGTLYASQNDVGGFGNFATMFDNFTLSQDTVVTDVHWTGGYFNGAEVNAPTQFTVNFYADAGGSPGAQIGPSEVIIGDAGETPGPCLISFPCTYTFDPLPTSFLASAGVTYWLSIVPDLGFPPQWGWGTGTGGDGASWQVFFGAGAPVAADMAFDLSGHPTQINPTPEPATMALLGIALAGLGLSRRRKQS